MRRPFLALLLMLPVALAACAPSQSRMGAHLNTTTGHVSPSIGTNLGPVRVVANGSGGAVGTRLGPIGLSAGF